MLHHPRRRSQATPWYAVALLLALGARPAAAQRSTPPADDIPRVRLVTAAGAVEGDLLASTPDSLLLQLSQGEGDQRVDMQRWFLVRCVLRARSTTTQADPRGTAIARAAWLVPATSVVAGTLGYVLTRGVERPHVYETSTTGPRSRNLAIGLAAGAGAGLVAAVWSGWRHPARAWTDAPALVGIPDTARTGTPARACGPTP